MKTLKQIVKESGLKCYQFADNYSINRSLLHNMIKKEYHASYKGNYLMIKNNSDQLRLYKSSMKPLKMAFQIINDEPKNDHWAWI